MENAFGPNVQSDPNWSRIDTRLKAIKQQTQDSFLIHLIEAYEGKGYHILKGDPGKGSFTDGTNITIDGSIFKTTGTNHTNPAMTTADINAFLATIAHEIGHVLNPNDAQRNWINQLTADAGVDAELYNEAYAIADSYRAMKQIGLTMSLQPNTVGANIQTILDNLYQSYGGNQAALNDEGFWMDAVSAARTWVEHAIPSNAARAQGTSLQYPEYARASWAVHVANINATDIDWQKVAPGQIQLTEDIQNNRLHLTWTAPLPMRNGTTMPVPASPLDFVRSSLDPLPANTPISIVNSAGQIGTISRSINPDGSRRVTLDGLFTGSEISASATNSDVRLNAAPPRREDLVPKMNFFGDGNTLTNADRNWIVWTDIVGSNNTINLQYLAKVDVSGRDNVITFTDTFDDGIIVGPQFEATISGVHNTVNVPRAVESNTFIAAWGFDHVVNGNDAEIQTAIGLETSITINGTRDKIVVNGVSDLINMNGNDNDLEFTNPGTAVINGINEDVTGNGCFLTLASGASIALSGTGHTVTLGTSSGVTLAANGSATFTGNSGAVNATASGTTIAVNGSGNTITKGTGGTSTINGSNNRLTLNGTGSSAALTGSGQIITATSSTLTLGANTTASITGNNNALNLTGASVAMTLTGTNQTANGSNAFITLANNATMTLTGTTNSVTLGTGNTVTLGASSSATITGNGATVRATGASDTVTVNGSSNNITKAAGGAVTVNGSNNQLNVTGSGVSASLSGSGQTITAASCTIALGNNSTGSIIGSSNTVNLGTGVAVTLNGTSQTVSGSSDFITLTNSSTMTLTGTSNNVTLGTGNTVTLGASSSATVTGNGGTIRATGSGDTITVNGSSNAITKAGGGSAAVNGSNNQLSITASGVTATLSGSGHAVSAASDTINMLANCTGTITGNSNTVTLAAAAAATLNGTGLNLTGTSAFITLAASGSATIGGTGNTINTGGGASATITGSTNSVTLGTSSPLTLAASTHHNNIVSAGNAITFGNNAKGTIAGASNTITLGTGNKIYLSSGSDVVHVNSGDIVYLASNIDVTIQGNGATIVGNTGNVISVTGTNNRIFADSSHVVVNGTNTGDVVYGTGNTGSNWGGYVQQSGAYGGYSGGGYFSGSGLMANRTKSLADISEIGATDEAQSAQRVRFPERDSRARPGLAPTLRMADQLVQAMAGLSRDPGALSTDGRDAMDPLEPHQTFAKAASITHGAPAARARAA